MSVKDAGGSLPAAVACPGDYGSVPAVGFEFSRSCYTPKCQIVGAIRLAQAALFPLSDVEFVGPVFPLLRQSLGRSDQLWSWALSICLGALPRPSRSVPAIPGLQDAPCEETTSNCWTVNLRNSPVFIRRFRRFVQFRVPSWVISQFWAHLFSFFKPLSRQTRPSFSSP